MHARLRSSALIGGCLGSLLFIFLLGQGWLLGGDPGSAPSGPAAPAWSGGPFEVKTIKDVAYYDGPDAHPVKHKLDLYLPKKEAFPVVIFIHGGAWKHGDKNFMFGIYGKIAQLFARNGVGFVVANYRLSPDVRHPGHVEDVAKAFAWVYKHIAAHGGKTDQVFLSGHSAGGHLVSLLATDGQYLEPHGLKTQQIRGVIPISGVYQIPPEKNFFPSVFGDDPKARQLASPVHHVRPNLPPFLILYGDDDFPTLDENARLMHNALIKAKNDAQLLEIKQRDHFSIVGRMLAQQDTAVQALLQFLVKHASLSLRPMDTDGAKR